MNCCQGDHLPSTGEVGRIKILRLNHRPAKNELEFAFEVFEKGHAPPQAPSSSSSKTGQAHKEEGTPTIDVDNVQVLTKAVLDMVLKETKEGNTDEQIREKVGPRVELLLTALKNSSYAKGFTTKQQ